MNRNVIAARLNYGNYNPDLAVAITENQLEIWTLNYKNDPILTENYESDFY